jgi:hypothetical protein
MRSCREITRLASEQLDRKLSLPQRIELRLHLFICERCRRYAEQLRSLRLFLRDPRCAVDAPSASVRQTLSSIAKERLKKALDRSPPSQAD